MSTPNKQKTIQENSPPPKKHPIKIQLNKIRFPAPPSPYFRKTGFFL